MKFNEVPKNEKFKIPEVKTPTTEKKEQKPLKTEQELQQEQKSRDIKKTQNKITDYERIQSLRQELGATDKGEEQRIETELQNARMEATKLEGSENEVKTSSSRRILLPQDIEKIKQENSEKRFGSTEQLLDDITKIEDELATIDTEADKDRVVQLLADKQRFERDVKKLDPDQLAVYTWGSEAVKHDRNAQAYENALKLSPEEFNARYGEMAEYVRGQIPNMIAKSKADSENARRIVEGLKKKTEQ